MTNINHTHNNINTHAHNRAVYTYNKIRLTHGRGTLLLASPSYYILLYIWYMYIPLEASIAIKIFKLDKRFLFHVI